MEYVKRSYIWGNSIPKNSYKTLEQHIEHTRKQKKSTYNYEQLLKCKYGLTLDQKCEMAVKQEYKCANLKCRAHLDWSNITKIPVDHCHTTGKVRELLCSGCNTTLGLLERGGEKLEGLLEYIARHKVA